MALAAGYDALFPKSPNCHQVILPSSLTKTKSKMGLMNGLPAKGCFFAN
jgi:hypothetical protein